MLVLQALSILVVMSSLQGAMARAETSETDMDGTFYRIIEPVGAPTYIRGTDGKWKASGESVYFNKNDFVKPDFLGPDGSLWLKVTSAKNNEIVGIPSEVMKTGTSWLGERELIKQSEWLNGKFDYVYHRPTARPLPDGKMWKIEKYFGRLGREDAVVYFDSDPRYRLVLRKNLRTGNSRCLDEQFTGKKCEGPSTEDAMRIIGSGISYILDPTIGSFVPRLFYQVETSFCTVGSLDHCGEIDRREIQGWVEARKVGMLRRPAIPYVPSPLPSRKFPVNGEQDHNEKDMRGQFSVPVLTDGNDEFTTQVLNKVGSCLGVDYVTQARKIRDDLIRTSQSSKGGGWSADLSALQRKKYQELGKSFFGTKVVPFDYYLKDYWKIQPSPKLTGSDLSNDQLYTIDSLARSLYGEMRSCGGQEPAYYKAVARAIINRAIIVKMNGPVSPFVKDSKAKLQGKSVDQIVPYVVSSSYQISSWNSWDSNLKDNLCPVNKSTNWQQWEAWKVAVDVAWKAVASKKEFLEETSSITHTHYYSPEALDSGKNQPDWAVEKRKEVHFRVGNQWYGSSGCLVLVKDKYDSQIEAAVRHGNY